MWNLTWVDCYTGSFACCIVMGGKEQVTEGKSGMVASLSQCNATSDVRCHGWLRGPL